MTARGAGDLLTRTTSIAGGLFFVLCLTLTLLPRPTATAARWRTARA
jgi:preprotein translocase subunit SecG